MNGTLLAAALAVLVAAAPARATVVGFGLDAHDQLGIGFRQMQVLLPQPVGLPDGMQSPVGGGSIGGAVVDGTLYVAGGDQFGQLGNGTKGKGLEWQLPAPILEGVRSAAFGAVNGAAVMDDGTVRTWGANQFGQIGNGGGGNGKEYEGIKLAVTSPYRVPGITGAMQVLAGATTYALLADGTVWGWGEDETGQLGDDGPGNKTSPIEISGLSSVVQIASGGVGKQGGHLLALKANGSLWALGGQHNGELGDGQEDEPALTPVKILEGVSGIASSATNGAAIVNGHLWTWGQGARGALGYEPPSLCGNQKAPRPCALQPREVPGLSGVSEVALGFQTTYAMKGTELLDWGKNERGALGDGTRNDRGTPMVVLHGALQVAAEHEGALVAISGAAPAQRLTATSGKRSIAVAWISASRRERFQVTARQGTTKQTARTTAHSYTFTGLEGSWRVAVNGPRWGRASIEVMAG